ncbi:hypothetical protein ABTY96_28570 [Streptomyces sp. NPDC096057]|uniref:DUF6907 domain-containing protein n=1 Tax=Streptomyces sp. NPDC096057 TaxID=3155543 RepID=UPI003333C953
MSAVTQNATTPQVRPGHRLVPALIRWHREVTAQTVWIECPTWCSEPHHAVAQLAVEDIVHSSHAVYFGVDSIETTGMVFGLHAQIKADPQDSKPQFRQAHIVIDDGQGEDAFLTVDRADALADRLVAFAAQVRRLARTARAHQQQAEVTA